MASPPKASTIFQTSTSLWGTSVQTSEPMGGIPHLNQKRMIKTVFISNNGDDHLIIIIAREMSKIRGSQKQPEQSHTGAGGRQDELRY